MYCENCGKEIEKDSEFCAYCGTKVKEEIGSETDCIQGDIRQSGDLKIDISEETGEAETEKSGGQRKFKKGIIVAAATAIVIVLAAFINIWLHNAPARQLAKQLDLGNRYLEEMDYEQAVVAFTKAIEIDPMNVDAYIGAADAYIGLGDLESAKAVLEQGMKMVSDETIDTKLKEVLDEIDRMSGEERNKESDLSVDKEIEKNTEEMKYSSLLNAMRELIIAEDYEQANVLVQTQEYMDMINSLHGDESYYSGEYDENGERSGTGISVHLNNIDGAYFYYGSWSTGKRNGTGKVVFLSPSSSVIPYGIFTGEWENDLPNGEGEEKYHVIPPDDFEECMSWCSLVQGTYADGLYDGEIYHEETGCDGLIDSYYGTAEKGIWITQGETDDGWVKIMIRKDGGYMSTLPENNKDEGILRRLLPPEN